MDRVTYSSQSHSKTDPAPVVKQEPVQEEQPKWEEVEDNGNVE